MSRNPYILTEGEIKVLFKGLVEYGEDETYGRMRDKVITAMLMEDDIDDMLMDMHDTILKRARQSKDEEQKVFYRLAVILRKLAHEIYYTYIKAGKKRNNERFLRLIIS